MIDSCRSRADFTALRRGRRFESDALWISFAPDPELDRPRVAFAIGRRQGTAVARNRVRRRLREILREHSSALVRGRYLIGTRQPASTVSYRQARTELLFLLETASGQNCRSQLARSDLAPSDLAP
ncbi:ribonuclease P protein component [Candidatus Poriferisodalis sp.]|uniref:ribonuclease P protein component n=1 Tax=Candidatus Poriferisodalis sp. TaxID=3101277 RepID=UPI003D10E546